MSTDDYDPTKAPQVRLWTHILQKGFQAGSVLGTGIIAPAQASWQFFKHQHALDPAQFANATGRTTAAVFGLVAILGAARTSQIDKEGFEDRAYRLYYNKGQNRTDAFAQVGALAGLAAGALLFRGAANVTAFHYLGAASTGTAVGVLAHVLSMPKED